MIIISKLVCPKCGNKQDFYIDVSVQAKIKVNNKGESLQEVYDIQKNIIDNYFEQIYCAKCNTIVEE